MMNELKFSTKAGKKVYEMGNRCEGYTLRDVYGKASKAKEEAYDECLKMWNETEDSSYLVWLDR